MPEPRSPMASFAQSVHNIIDGPVTWFRETIVEPNQKKQAWYHQRFQRVPTIDQCYTDDAVCRLKPTSSSADCTLYEAPDHMKKCKPILEQYEKAAENWFINANGDLGGYANAKSAYMKQKHRLIWERRHGPVGSGMKSEEASASPAAEE
ncbi:unnamed protein product [Ceratitis capitata]|uniref:NADH dehydrogenase [ubiquinone] 1 beta subcomplex subunit 10 n=1 Tax=Ceratitis capitata TaxID=7213 RepID=A0A811UHZ3_CERCA|nr:unnamed protein product [Ceratitis capitata]